MRLKWRLDGPISRSYNRSTDNRDYKTIMQSDYQVFAKCTDTLDAVMPAHVIYPAVDSVSAGYSSVWIKEKSREELGFDGVVFSDDLTMAAAHRAGSPEIRVQMALKAGCDMVLVCNDRSSALIVMNWLEENQYPANAKLNSMKGRASAEIADLYSAERWAEARALIESLNL